MSKGNGVAFFLPKVLLHLIIKTELSVPATTRSRVLLARSPDGFKTNLSSLSNSAPATASLRGVEKLSAADDAISQISGLQVGS